MSTQIIIPILASTVCGLLIGYAIRALLARWQALAMERQAAAKLQEADEESGRRLREADIRARSEIVKAREAFAETMRERQAALQEYDDRIAAREADIERKMHVIEEKERALQIVTEQQRETAASFISREDEIEAREREAERTLRKIAGMTRNDALTEMRESVKEQVNSECGVFFRRRYEEAKNEADRKAAEVVAYAISRYCGVHSGEGMTSTVILPGAELKGRIIGRDGRNVRAFEAATGVTLLMDSTSDAIVISCFNPIRREIAKRALTALVEDGRFHPASIESAVKKAQDDFDAKLGEIGYKVVTELGLEGLSHKLVQAVGRLAYRSSYAQNLMEHSIEVANLMGSMADELKLDSALARRIGLLHDIGKTLNDNVTGPHAKIGAELLKAEGESQILVNAVAAHHGDVEAKSAYALLCSAADAISAARPGARNESTAIYYERLTQMEDLAKRHKGVESAFAIKAGHELRVSVKADKVSEDDAVIMARDICAEIESVLTYPGQIRVIVIREQRFVEYAR